MLDYMDCIFTYLYGYPTTSSSLMLHMYINRSRIVVSRELVKHSERISLVSAVNSNRVLNRRMVRDLMEYLDAVRPPNLGINEWDDIIVRNLKVQKNHFLYIHTYIHTCILPYYKKCCVHAYFRGLVRSVNYSIHVLQSCIHTIYAVLLNIVNTTVLYTHVYIYSSPSEYLRTHTYVYIYRYALQTHTYMMI